MKKGKGLFFLTIFLAFLCLSFLYVIADEEVTCTDFDFCIGESGCLNGIEHFYGCHYAICKGGGAMNCIFDP